MTYCREKDAYGGTCGKAENWYGGMCAEHRIRALEAELREARLDESELENARASEKARAEAAEAKLAEAEEYLPDGWVPVGVQLDYEVPGGYRVRQILLARRVQEAKP